MCSATNNPCKNGGMCKAGTDEAGAPKANCDCTSVADFEGETCEDITSRKHPS